MGVILAPIVEGKLDVWFREKIKEVHGLDVTQPPPGPAARALPRQRVLST